MNTQSVDTKQSVTATETPSTSPEPIRSVSVVKTGTTDAHAQHFLGSRLNPLLWVFFGRKWLLDRPINVYVIEHEQGLVLFDAGMSGTVATDPEFWPDRVTRIINGKIFRFHIGPEDTLTRQLELAGYAASDVKKAVISHLHFDHVGCITEIPQAELFVAPEAWEHMLGAHPEREAVLRRDIEVDGANWTKIAFRPVEDESLAPFTLAHDLMGDGSMMVIPTPGHMPGSVSMLVRTDPPLLLVGDLCYSLELLMQDQFPGTGEKEVLAETYAKVRELIEHMPYLVVLPAHDPDAAALLKTHPLFSG